MCRNPRDVILARHTGTFGAGADYRLARHWAARAQADLLLLHGQGVWDTNPRLSLGAVYRFGH